MNPVHFFFMCCVTIFWTAKIRSVLDPITGSMCEMKFLRLNINDDNNKNMNIVGISNHIHNQ